MLNVQCIFKGNIWKTLECHCESSAGEWEKHGNETCTSNAQISVPHRPRLHISNESTARLRLNANVQQKFRHRIQHNVLFFLVRNKKCTSVLLVLHNATLGMAHHHLFCCIGL